MYVFVLSSSINGLCHQVGYRNFDNTATNIRFVALLTGGRLVALWLILSLDYLVRALFSWVSWLGWLGAALVGVFFVAVAVVVGRELAGLFRLKQLARLRLQGEAAASNNDREGAVRTLRALITLYGDKPDTARGRRLVAAHLGEIIDGHNLLVLAERDLITPLDKRAKLLASAAARRSCKRRRAPSMRTRSRSPPGQTRRVGLAETR